MTGRSPGASGDCIALKEFLPKVPELLIHHFHRFTQKERKCGWRVIVIMFTGHQWGGCLWKTRSVIHAELCGQDVSTNGAWMCHILSFFHIWETHMCRWLFFSEGYNNLHSALQTSPWKGTHWIPGSLPMLTLVLDQAFIQTDSGSSAVGRCVHAEGSQGLGQWSLM